MEEKPKKKQIPYRYDEKTEEHFKDLFKFQYCTTKRNEALTTALRVTSTMIKKCEELWPPEEERYTWQDEISEYKINEVIELLPIIRAVQKAFFEIFPDKRHYETEPEDYVEFVKKLQAKMISIKDPKKISNSGSKK